MGFWDKLGQITMNILEKAPDVIIRMGSECQKRQSELYSKYDGELKKYERKIEEAERKSNTKSYDEQIRIKEMREKLDQAKNKLYGNSFNKFEEVSLEKFNNKWRCIGKLETANLTPYNKFVGLYRHTIDGKTMYVGRAIELYNGGLRKRLSDYRRESDSARKNKSAKMINDNLSHIITYILVLGDTPEAIDLAKKLEGEFIVKYNPPWNKMKNI